MGGISNWEGTKADKSFGDGRREKRLIDVAVNGQGRWRPMEKEEEAPRSRPSPFPLFCLSVRLPDDIHHNVL